MADEKIIDKIRKCLNLSLNNPSKEEAESAALMAQRLMVKHGVSVMEIEEGKLEEEEKIEIAKIVVGPGKAWKFELATVVADNFRCKTFHYGKRTIAFYGHSTDAQAAKEVFKFLFDLGHVLGYRVARKRLRDYGECAGVYNSYVLGFVEGIKSKLEAQCRALIIVIAPSVVNEYDKFSSDCNGGKGMKEAASRNLLKDGLDRKAYNDGYRKGKDAVSEREIEAKK